ncbi:MAG TPA: sigma-70 family RNA polymerase sigma factor [Verrucomicrobiae bacterium]|nr:sigma-70 family RNA polymerase sigma factor [Verrucomicrobiae bacterium]
MTSDLELLQQFARENSQDAFAEIVRRHLDLVYSAALRQVRSPQLAEDIAQSVFADLAQNADKLKSNTILTAWLYTVTRRTAVDVIRKESRRQLREQIAAEMQNMNATANDWTQIAPLLDDAMAALDETDRAAILLRYFENKNLREVGEQLNISDDAAQKRVSRAMGRLHDFFSKQKITIGASGLVVLISANAVQSAPVGLAAIISAAVLTGTAVSTSAVVTTTKVIAMTALQKSIIGVAFVAAVGTGVFEAHQNSESQKQIESLQRQQNSLSDRLAQLQRERDEATNQLAGVLAENAQLKSGSNQNELLRLRGEVTQLKTANAQNDSNDPADVAAKGLAIKVKQMKQWLEQNPNQKIPELQFLTERDWLNAANSKAELVSDDDYHWDLHNLFDAAEDRFGVMAEKALKKYIQANSGQFPADLSQLQPYFDSPVDSAILQRYEIVPASNIPGTKELSDTWLIAQKNRIFENYKSEDREVIGPNGYGSNWSFW